MTAHAGALAAFLACLLFLIGVVYMAVRDHAAAQRCERQGGQTWDSGEHCVFGGQIVSTR